MKKHSIKKLTTYLKNGQNRDLVKAAMALQLGMAEAELNALAFQMDTKAFRLAENRWENMIKLYNKAFGLKDSGLGGYTVAEGDVRTGVVAGTRIYLEDILA